MKNDNLLTPVISVVIPLYNGYEKIQKCIFHLDKQTINVPFEVLIVDDASPDQSGVKLEKLIKELDNPARFIVIKCEVNGRAGKARNIGIKNARGKYIVFIDQDDYPDYKMLETLYTLIDDGKYDCASCDIVDKNGKEYHRHPAVCKNIISTNEKKNVMQHFGYVFANLIKKQVLIDNNLFFPENVMFEDALYNFGVLACINSLNTTDQALYYREDDDNSQTAFLSLNKLKDRVKATETYLNNYKVHPVVSEYMDIINQYAFYYIYLSCTWWMLTDSDLYDKIFFNQCMKEGHELNINWKDIIKTQSYFGKYRLRILKLVYNTPWLAPVIRYFLITAIKIKINVRKKRNL